MGWFLKPALIALAAASATVVMHDAAWPQTAAPQTTPSVACKGESECIKRFPKLFSRARDVLRLKLANGRIKTFKDEKTEGEGYKAYVLSSYYPQWHSVVVNVGYYEGGAISVVNHRTGATVEPLNTPHYSNSGASFAAVGNCDAYCDEGIEVWSTSSDPPQRVFKHEPVGGRRYEFSGWDGEDRLKVRVSRFGPREGGSLPPDKTLPAEVVRGPNGWQLVEPPMKDD